ncbi:MAG TPA: dihydrolipoamide acetyltransferase family protein [Streptosporangiaceae bacterium]|nr:dihydrolipoamide acetyltransferase family protein [Streptosporangiaceae bacterium]
MTDLKQFRLPDVGEGLTEADIVSWHVKPGDKVTVNQVIVEIETAKAVVELPSPWDGVVAHLLVDEGQTVDVGTPIITVDLSGEFSPDTAPIAPPDQAAAGTPANAGFGTDQISQDPEQAREGGPPAAGAPPQRGDVGTPAAGEPAEERHAVLVGYGVKPGAKSRRPRRASPPTRPGATGVPAPPPAPAVAAPAAGAGIANGGRPAAPAPGHPALAKPPVRKLARDLGVDLSRLTGTGPHGSITRDDIQRAAGAATAEHPADQVFAGTAAMGVQPATAGRPREERLPVRSIRKRMAEAMISSAFTAPHVTEFLQVDVTETMNAVRRVRDLPEFGSLRVSPLLFVARALLVAIGRHPMINSTWDEQAQEIVVRNYVNLGIAAATERGLIVPNVKDAHLLSLPALARALTGLTATARDGRSTPADLTGGTITITNVGVFGVDAGTPILTPGEAAILAFGQVRDLPWVCEGQITVRKVTTLSLSFDHRIVDGELGSAVLRDVGQMLEDPLRMLAWA